MKDLKRTKIIKIKGDSFTFDIADITVNNFLTIEAEKQRLAAGSYAKIATSLLLNSQNAANLIDMIATFRTLKPEIEERVKTKDFSTLNMIDSKELLTIYVTEFLPWYIEWLKEFNSPFTIEEAEVTEDDKK